MKKFTEDDIRRDLPPDVMGLIHDLAYYRSGSHIRTITFRDRAQAILRERSDDDLRNMLIQREEFMLHRAIDQMCEKCRNGEEVDFLDDMAMHASSICPAHPIHEMLANWRPAMEAIDIFERTKGGSDLEALNRPRPDKAQELAEALMYEFHVAHVAGDVGETDKTEVVEFVREWLKKKGVA